MLPIPQRLLGEALLFSAAAHPEKIAIITDDNEYSYGMLKESAEKMARHMIKSGIQKGDRVAIYLENSWECIVSIYAVLFAGAVFVVINPQTKPGKLKFILQDSGARIFVSKNSSSRELFDSIAEVTSLSELILCSEQEVNTWSVSAKTILFKQALTDFEDNCQLPNIIPNDLAALIYTSGSTGFPKGVMMTHQSMVFTSWSLIQYLRLSENDRIMLLLPLAFDYGLYQLIMAVTTGGTLIVEQPFFFTASLCKSIEKNKPTVFPGVPTLYAMLISAAKESQLQFDTIEKVTNTAAALPAEFIPELKKLFPHALIFKMYGLTECKRVCYLEPELIDIKPNSVGKAIPGTEVYLLSPDGKPAPKGEPGILHIRGPHVMLGYWNNEALSREMLKPGKLPWERVLCSHDWFRMDEDGCLYFLGRNDDIIKTRGEKVSPVEIENVIYRIDGVKEVAVVGKPDTVMGESIVVYITKYSVNELNEKEVQRICMTQLEHFMIPQKVVFLDEMPKSPNGKIDKKELALMPLA